MKKTIIISDLHISEQTDPNSTTILGLRSFLERLDSSKCEQLVILGDFLDRWALPINVKPKSYKDLLNTDQCKSITSELKICSDSNIKIYYMNGNHDFDLKNHDLPSYIKLITPDKFTNSKKHKNSELYMEHGNAFDLFHAVGKSDDKKLKFPLGYFKTRINSTNMKNYPSMKIDIPPMNSDLHVHHVKEKIISELNVHRINRTTRKEIHFDDLLTSYGSQFLFALKKDIMLRFPDKDINSIIIEIPDDKAYNKKTSVNFIKDVFPNYNNFVKNFYKQLFPDPSDTIEWEALMYAIDPVRTGGLEYYAKMLAKNPKMSKVKNIVFGHTHMCQIHKLDKDYPNYANSGCWCSNLAGPNTTSIHYDGETITQHNDDVNMTL